MPLFDLAPEERAHAEKIRQMLLDLRPHFVNIHREVQTFLRPRPLSQLPANFIAKVKVKKAGKQFSIPALRKLMESIAVRYVALGERQKLADKVNGIFEYIKGISGQGMEEEEERDRAHQLITKLVREYPFMAALCEQPCLYEHWRAQLQFCGLDGDHPVVPLSPKRAIYDLTGFIYWQQSVGSKEMRNNYLRIRDLFPRIASLGDAEKKELESLFEAHYGGQEIRRDRTGAYKISPRYYGSVEAHWKKRIPFYHDLEHQCLVTAKKQGNFVTFKALYQAQEDMLRVSFSAALSGQDPKKLTSVQKRSLKNKYLSEERHFLQGGSMFKRHPDMYWLVSALHQLHGQLLDPDIIRLYRTPSYLLMTYFHLMVANAYAVVGMNERVLSHCTKALTCFYIANFFRRSSPEAICNATDGGDEVDLLFRTFGEADIQTFARLEENIILEIKGVLNQTSRMVSIRGQEFLLKSPVDTLAGQIRNNVYRLFSGLHGANESIILAADGCAQQAHQIKGPMI